MRDHLKEFSGVYLRVAHDIPERVGKCGLELEQRLQGEFVDALEAVSIEIGEVLTFKFLDQILIGVGQE